MKGIADTGLLVAFANRADEHHDWAMAVAEKITEPLLTCEAVLSEAAFHLRDSSLVLALAADGMVLLAFDAGDHLPQLAALAKRYADREPDFADLCLIRMSELFPNHSVVTVDGDSAFIGATNGRSFLSSARRSDECRANRNPRSAGEWHHSGGPGIRWRRWSKAAWSVLS